MKTFVMPGALIRLLGAGLFLFLLGCARTPANPLRVATHPFTGYESMHLAQGLGYFSAADIRLVEMASASQSSQALRNGTVDAAMLTLDESLVLMQDGVDLQAVLVMDVSNGADVVMARPGISSLSALRGRRIGVETSAIGAVMLDAMLTAGGLKPSDVKLISIPANEHAAAYRQAKVDAVVTYEPTRTQLLGDGASILFDSSRVPGRIVDVLVVRSERISGHRAALASLVAAHFKALAYLSAHPQDSAARLAPFLGVSPDQVLPQFSGLVLPDLAENRSQLSGDAPKLNGAAAELAGLMLRRRLLQAAVTTDTLSNPSFLPPRAN